MKPSLVLPGVDRLPSPEHRASLSQWDTPEWLARRMAEWIGDAESVLEPSAGRGALIAAALELGCTARIDAVEIDPLRAQELVYRLTDSSALRAFVFTADYLQLGAPSVLYDVALANPPFTDGVETEHVAKMLDECNRVIVQLPIRALHGAERDARWLHRLGRDWWLRREARLTRRPYPNASDDIIVCELSRERGPCEPEWWR